MLVAAMLGPEQGEDGELEVVRLPPEQLDDALQLPVGQPEGPVKASIGKRLLGERRQGTQSRAGTRRGADTLSPE
jgi:hypothetical protein